MTRSPTLWLLVLVAVMLSGCGQAPTGETDTQAPSQFVTLSVPGMSCSTCPIRVETGLKRANGVISAEASLKTKQARVTFDPERIDVAGLINAIAEAGFEAHEEEA